jgi:hypothetical protein
VTAQEQLSQLPNVDPDYRIEQHSQYVPSEVVSQLVKQSTSVEDLPRADSEVANESVMRDLELKQFPSAVHSDLKA